MQMQGRARLVSTSDLGTLVTLALANVRRACRQQRLMSLAPLIEKWENISSVLHQCVGTHLKFSLPASAPCTSAHLRTTSFKRCDLRDRGGSMTLRDRVTGSQVSMWTSLDALSSSQKYRKKSTMYHARTGEDCTTQRAPPKNGNIRSRNYHVL